MLRENGRWGQLHPVCMYREKGWCRGDDDEIGRQGREGRRETIIPWKHRLQLAHIVMVRRQNDHSCVCGSACIQVDPSGIPVARGGGDRWPTPLSAQYTYIRLTYQQGWYQSLVLIMVMILLLIQLIVEHYIDLQSLLPRRQRLAWSLNVLYGNGMLTQSSFLYP